jgi:hypothetical protein
LRKILSRDDVAVARSDSVKTQSRLRLLEEKMNLLADLQHEEERRRSAFFLCRGGGSLDKKERKKDSIYVPSLG